MANSTIPTRFLLLLPALWKILPITGDTASADTKRFLESTFCPVLGKSFTIEAIRQLL
tara:strand:+ start:422 stop:595 length:174 start_codon:yes stop_codon:yes gene_type:complete